MPVLVVIPARLGSTRLPHKPLQLLAGEPLVTRVIERVRELGVVDELVVATDAPMVAEVAALKEFAGFDVIANIQGDEPFLDAAALTGAIARVTGGDDVGTAAA